MLAGRPLLYAALAAGVGCGQDPILDRAESDALRDRMEAIADMEGGTPRRAPAVPPAGPRATGGVLATLHGVVSAPEGLSAPIRVDVFDGDQTRLDGPRPSVVAVQQLGPARTFDIQVPLATGQVWVGAFADLDGNGRPDPGEPTGWSSRNPIATTGDAVGIEISLEVAP